MGWREQPRREGGKEGRDRRGKINFLPSLLTYSSSRKRILGKKYQLFPRRCIAVPPYRLTCAGAIESPIACALFTHLATYAIDCQFFTLIDPSYRHTISLIACFNSTEMKTIKPLSISTYMLDFSLSLSALENL